MLRRLKVRLFPPIEPTHRFLETPEELASRIGDIDERGISELTRLSESIFREPVTRSEAAERRATTLLSAAGITGSLSLAGGSLLLDTQKLSVAWMRLTFGAILTLVLGCFAMAAIRALVTLKVLDWSEPTYENLLPNGKGTERRFELLRACTLLHLSARNEGNARWKIAQARASTGWFMRGVVFLFAAFLLLILIATFGHPTPLPDSKGPDNSVVPCPTSRWDGDCGPAKDR